MREDRIANFHDEMRFPVMGSDGVVPRRMAERTGSGQCGLEDMVRYT
jgi:hypothetical protein